MKLVELNPSAKPEDRDLLLVRLVDARHIELKIAPPLPMLQLERADGEPKLFDKWDSTRSYSPDDYLANNPEMQRIVDADQADRKDGMHIDWKRVTPADALRRTQTAALLQKGELHTGPDFEHAAYVFQHGDTPDDYLLAHALATVAISKGQSGAVWIAAATLDRYLQSVHQPQIFGTQFQTLQDKPTTQDPYNRTLISDALRGEMGVPTQAEQDVQRDHYDVERGLAQGKGLPSKR